jgi:hypothetical protein
MVSDDDEEALLSEGRPAMAKSCGAVAGTRDKQWVGQMQANSFSCVSGRKLLQAAAVTACLCSGKGW